MNQYSRIKAGELVVVGLLYAVATVAYLWFAVRPAEYSTHLQTLDSVFIAAVMDHVSRAPFDSALRFWDFGIFYPVPNTLCLSEPMITPAILMSPLVFTAGYVVAYNTWIYFCWWSLAMSAWYCLRKMGLTPLACLWAGFVIAFNPDRAWHVAGHGHLLFASGLFISLIALQKALHDDSWRWRLIFAVSLLLQLFSGIYMTAIVAMWAVFVMPAIIWQSARNQGVSIYNLVRHRGKFVLVTLAVGGILYLPIVAVYSDFSKDRHENPMYQLIGSSASWEGYLKPSLAPGRIETFSGSLMKDVLTINDGGEDNQYLGAVTLLLMLLAAPVLIWAAVRRQPSPISLIVLGGVILGGVICLALSFGPYSNDTASVDNRLPFSYLYSHVPQIRFFRAPSRFAYGVQWSAAIIGACALSVMIMRLQGTRFRHAGTVLGVSCIAVTAADFFPVNDLYRIPCTTPELARFHRESGDNKPYVPLPLSFEDTLVRLGWDQVPTADGYSGYFPRNRRQELAKFEETFPANEALSIMQSWDVPRVYVSKSRGALRNRLRNDKRFSVIHEGDEGSLLEVTTQTATLAELHQRLKQANAASAAATPLAIIRDGKLDPGLSPAGITAQLYHMKPHPDGGMVYEKPGSIMLRFTKAPLYTPAYDRLVIRYRISNWYDLREAGALYFTNTARGPLSEKQKVEFVLNADGEYHELEVPLSESYAWVLQKQANELRIDLGSRPNDLLHLESLVFY